jgi:hypothetical protein
MELQEMMLELVPKYRNLPYFQTKAISGSPECYNKTAEEVVIPEDSWSTSSTAQVSQ